MGVSVFYDRRKERELIPEMKDLYLLFLEREALCGDICFRIMRKTL